MASSAGLSSISDPSWPTASLSSIFQEARPAKACCGDESCGCDDLAEQLKELNFGCQVPPLTSPRQPTCAATSRSSSSSQTSVLATCDLAGVAEYILSGNARNIVVMAGAGISVSSGIPDFRTPGTGLYSQLERFSLPWPEAVFDIRFFRHNPKPFYLLAKELFPGGYCPTPAHFFLRLLHEKGLLLTCFTQNIDGLEQLAGLPAEKVVPAHGSFDGAHCIDCGRAASVYAVQQAVFDDEVAHCDTCGGLVKPDIVFFGEPLPARFHRRRLADLQKADLLIVIGTSLVVQPFASMIDAVPANCPRLLINMTKVGERKQQQQELAAAAAARQHKLRHNSCSSDTSSSGDDADVNDTASCSGFESDATGLTASSSYLNMCDDSSSSSKGYLPALTADLEPSEDAGSSSSSSAASSSEPAVAAAADGFDFSSGVRDVLHLGAADEGVMQLATLLGWAAELEEIVKAGRDGFEEAKREWEDA